MLQKCFFYFSLLPTLLYSELNYASFNDQPTEEKHFVIVTPSYNNRDFYKRNLNSIFSQNYSNYTLIYCDDASPDGTYTLVKDYIEENQLQEKAIILSNSINRKANYNFYKAIHNYCVPSDIIVVLDGDDWFEDENVLTTLNQVYSNEDVWVTYGDYRGQPAQPASICAPVSKEFLSSDCIRVYPWRFTHLRTFYAGLFQQVALEDFVDGDFFEVTYDFSIMFPIIEMATTHTYFINKTLYVLNRETELSDEVVRPKAQMDRADYVLALPKYHSLSSLPWKYSKPNISITALISENFPSSARTTLEKLPNIDQIYSLGEASVDHFPQDQLHYVLLLENTNDIPLERELDHAIESLWITKGVGYYFQTNDNLKSAWDGLYFWDFRSTNKAHHQTNGVLYSYSSIKPLLRLKRKYDLDVAIHKWKDLPPISAIGITGKDSQ